MGHLVSRSVSAVCELGVPDRLADGPLPVAELAPAVGADSGALGRFLRVLAGEDLFDEVAPDVFGLTPLGTLLCADTPGSLRQLVELMGGEAFRVWEAAEHSLRTGDAAFPRVFGKPYFEWLTEHPDAAKRFDEGQAGLVELRLRPLLGLDWSGVGTVVDIGGGTGALLSRLLTGNAHLRGTVFDLPHVGAAAAPALADAGVADRATVAEGDFFERIPPGADVYVLSQILHDWADRDAVRILQRCREAMGADSRLLIVEHVLPENAGAGAAGLLDLHMLVLLGGQERTRVQWESLLARGGFRLVSVTEGPRSSVLEAQA
ncbi:methyltransferase [Streptomyces chromofuscus]|uniref:Methyltransferase n=2 Tax=Streptomyces chromofuscus TaxID=42881 RepID=A0A7M2TJ21_STRCW|nr:methyltransferase [Streptomyces chromofuscus]